MDAYLHPDILPRIENGAPMSVLSLLVIIPYTWYTANGTHFLCQNNGRRYIMVKVALFVRLEAKPGKEKEVESFLLSGLPLVQEEPGTTAWFGIRLGPSTFGIFDAFPDEAGRQAHLAGKVAAALMAKASDLFAKSPVIEKVDVLAAKLPA